MMLQDRLFKAAQENKAAWDLYVETLPPQKRPPAEVRNLSRSPFLGLLIKFFRSTYADNISGVGSLRDLIGQARGGGNGPEVPEEEDFDMEGETPEVSADDILKILGTEVEEKEAEAGKVEQAPAKKKESVKVGPLVVGMSEEQVKALVEAQAKKLFDDYMAKHNPPQVISLVFDDFETKVEGVIPDWLPVAAKYAKLRLPQYWFGPTGAGKTHMAAVLAKLMKLPFYVLSCSPGTPEEAFTAYLLPVGENGKWGNVLGTFAKAFSEGGLCLLDELDRAERTVLMVIQTALANGYLYLPQMLGDKRLEQHKDFVFVGAGNTAGHGADRKYTAAEQLDWASKDRWRACMIDVDYDEKVERKLCQSMGVPEIANIGHSLRSRCRFEIDKTTGKRTPRQGWDRDVSTRNILNWAKMVGSKLFTQEEALYGFFVDWSDKELGMINVVRKERGGKEPGRIIIG